MAETEDTTTETGEDLLPVALAEPTPGQEPEIELKPSAAAQADTKPRRGGFVAPVLGGVLAAAAGFGAAQYVPQGWPLAQTAALEQQLLAQSAEITRLTSRLSTLESQPAPELSPLMDTLAALNGRVADLETLPINRADDTEGLSAALAKLQAEMASLKAGATGDMTVPENVAALTAEAEAKLKAAEAHAAQITAEAEALTNAAKARAAFGRLKTAVDTGLPFAEILPELGVAVPDGLQSLAKTGVPSLGTLQDSFPDAARLALEAALRADMGDSWSERATSFLRNQTGARSLTPREGNDPDAILSRAESALATGDLAQTLTLLAQLPEVAQAPLAEWRAQAELRQAALVDLNDIAAKIGG